MSTVDLTLRPLAHDEAHSLFPIHQAAFATLVEEAHGGIDETIWRDRFVLELAPAETLVAELDGAIVGWMHVERAAGEWFVRQILIAPNMQGRGLGTQLMQHLIRQADNASAALCLSVYRINRAQLFYEKLGFKPYASDSTRIWMAYDPKQITSAAARLCRAATRMSNRHRFECLNTNEITGQILDITAHDMAYLNAMNGTLQRISLLQINLNTIAYYLDEWVTIEPSP